MAPHQAPEADLHHSANRPGHGDNVPNTYPAEVLIEPFHPEGGPLDAIEDVVIPDGMHSRDRSIPLQDLEHYSDQPAPFDKPGNLYVTGSKRFGTDNGNAFPTFERASHDFTAGQIWVTPNNGGTAIVVGRQRGRKNVTLWVPTSVCPPGSSSSVTPNGVTIGQTEGELQTGSGVQLNSGDSITISTEAPIWAALIGSNTSGMLQYLVEYNPGGGELGGQ